MSRHLRRLIMILFLSLTPGLTIGFLLANKIVLAILTLPFAIGCLGIFLVFWGEGIIDGN